MIPGVSLIELLTWGGVLIVMAIIFAESGLLIGFFLPGDSLLFTAGFLIQTGIIHFNIHFAVLLIFIAAVLGNSVGYAFGRSMGSKIFSKPDARIFKQEYLARANSFYEKHGAIAIILTRFIPIVRTFVPIVAGASKMDYRKFTIYNLVGGALWVAVVTYAGFLVGGILEKAGVSVDQIILPIVLIIIVISVLPAVIHVLRDKKLRDSIWSSAKKQFSELIGKR